MNDDVARGFYLHNKSWYAKSMEEPSISFGLYYLAGGSDSEVEITWKKIGAEISPVLTCYDDGWSALHAFSDLVAKLNEYNGEAFSPEEFEKYLRELGYADLTKYKRDFVADDNACVWISDPLEKISRFKTECGHKYVYDKSINYCPHCGKKIQIKE